MSVLEVVFVGQSEVCVCLDFVEFFLFFSATKLIGPRSGYHLFKNCQFFWLSPL